LYSLLSLLDKEKLYRGTICEDPHRYGYNINVTRKPLIARLPKPMWSGVPNEAPSFPIIEEYLISRRRDLQKCQAAIRFGKIWNLVPIILKEELDR
ncbi:hypothetical protein ACJX0J_024889, partial [Zea mays]